MFVQSNRLSAIKSYFHAQLKEQFSLNEINLMVKYLAIKRLDFKESEYVFHGEDLLSESDLLYFNFALKRIRANEPFQYVLGDVEFYGLELLCDKRALIPRPETEELVDWIVETFQNQIAEPLKFVDLCAGSGCIALALKSKFSNAEVIAAELSDEALQLIEENKLKTSLDIVPVKMDVLSTEAYERLKNEKSDCWVSNPPYIPMRDKTQMHENVLAFEPHLALFVDDEDPCVFYREIAAQAKECLKNKGWLFFELHEELGSEVEKIVSDLGFVNIELRKDLQGKERMLRAQCLSSRHESE